MDASEKLAQMMIRCGLATGHGDTIDDLIFELEKQTLPDPLPMNEVLLSMMKEIERLQRVQGTLIAAFRVNMMRLLPEFTHEEFDKAIAEFKEKE
jgi:hypothetical protein